MAEVKLGRQRSVLVVSLRERKRMRVKWYFAGLAHVHMNPHSQTCTNSRKSQTQHAQKPTEYSGCVSTHMRARMHAHTHTLPWPVPAWQQYQFSAS